MLYAVIADIHGNYPALRAVLEDAREAGAQQIDIRIGFPHGLALHPGGPGNAGSLENAVFVSGNREWYLDILHPAHRHRSNSRRCS